MRERSYWNARAIIVCTVAIYGSRSNEYFKMVMHMVRGGRRDNAN